MGNYRQHVGFASSLGVSYAVAMYFVMGVHWLYGSVAFMLATLGGLLPDVDSDTGVEMKTFTGVLGVLAAVSVWKTLDAVRFGMPFELHLWGMIIAYMLVKRGLRFAVGHLMIHRGMSHSLPTCLVWGCLTYLHYPSAYHAVRAAMALAVMLGFFSHLLLDETCSVDLRGARVNKAFGTALKFWAPSVLSTLAVYGLLALLSWKVIQVWPEGPLRTVWDVPPPDMTGAVKEAQAAIESLRR